VVQTILTDLRFAGSAAGNCNPPRQELLCRPPGQSCLRGAIVQNYLVFAILTTIFCCLPAGIPAIVYAAQVNGKLQMGDLAGAQQASKNAKLWCLISLGVGLGGILLYFVLIMAGVMGGMLHH
jgi:hypothetical protein